MFVSFSKKKLSYNRKSDLLKKLTAIHFIGVIPTVVLAIAMILASYALKVLASELLFRASLIFGVTFLSFVRAVAAVVIVVAKPPLKIIRKVSECEKTNLSNSL